MRTTRLALSAIWILAASPACGPTASPPASFSVVETCIPEIQAAMERGDLSARQLVVEYLTRIALYKERLNAAVAINQNAISEADALDAERARGQIRGPLLGIPVALKDNIHTTYLPTTGGSLAFAGFIPPYEATLTTNLRDAGAIIIAKAGLTNCSVGREASTRSSKSTSSMRSSRRAPGAQGWLPAPAFPSSSCPSVSCRTNPARPSQPASMRGPPRSGSDSRGRRAASRG